MNAETETVFFFGFIIFYFMLYTSGGGLQIHQVIITFLSHCCRYSGRSPEPWLLEFLQRAGKSEGRPGG